MRLLECYNTIIYAAAFLICKRTDYIIFVDKIGQQVAVIFMNNFCDINFRISKKIIVDEKQLSKKNVQIEIMEAYGMDFQGKVHLLESAIASKDLIELTVFENKMTGLPLLLEKQNGDVTLMLKNEKTQKNEIVFVSKISFVRIPQLRAL